MSWKKVRLGDVLKQYRIEQFIQDDKEYKQVTISKHSGVSLRGTKLGKHIGRKRQFLIDLKKYPNTLMFVRQGVEDGSIGIAPLEVDGCIATENMPMFSIEGIEKEYLSLLIKSKLFRNEVFKIPVTGSAQKAIHEKQLLQIEIPVPSKEKQKDIVIKLKEIYNKQSSIGNEIKHQKSLIRQLRQAFLKEAIQGKLVPQNPNDEPAIELLKKIKAEKKALTKGKTQKKENETSIITGEEFPFEIPESWVWCKLGEICDFVTKGTTPNTNKILKEAEVPYLKVYNIVNQKIDFIYKPQFIDVTTHRNELARSIVYPGDVLMNIVGPPLGKVAIVPNDYKEWNINQALAIFRPIILEINKFIYYYLVEGSEIQKLRPLGVVGQDNLSLEQCRNIIFPLPPLEEQKRIIQKIEQLLNYCNKFEETINEGQHFNEQLLQQVLKDALTLPTLKESLEAVEI